MLEILLVFGLFSWLMGLISKPYVKKIEYASTVDESVKYRSRLKWLRWGFSILFVAIYVGLSIYFNPDTDFWLKGGGKNVICVLFMYLVTQKGFKKLRGNVSSLTKEKFVDKYPSFALFLRGFEDDVYGIDDVKLNLKDKFSEIHFMEVLESYMPTCAIGMTKEVDAPFGAKRVYVSDESWKEDVRELMNRANLIFVLLNNRPSCIWEIEQSADVINKTCFLVEDIEKYNYIRSKLVGKIEFPDASKMEVKVPFALRIVDIPVRTKGERGLDNPDRTTTIANNFENSKDGYEKLLSILIEGQSAKAKKTLSLLSRISYYIIAFIILFFINVMISSSLLDSFGTDNQFLKCVVIVFLYIIEWLMYMVIKVSWKTRKKRNQ